MRIRHAEEFLDYYKILQVDPSAEQEIIVAVYRRLAGKYHPDKNPSSDAAERMRKINEAYEVLSSPEKRNEYDQKRKAYYDRLGDPATNSSVADKDKTTPSRQGEKKRCAQKQSRINIQNVLILIRNKDAVTIIVIIIVVILLLIYKFNQRQVEIPQMRPIDSTKKITAP